MSTEATCTDRATGRDPHAGHALEDTPVEQRGEEFAVEHREAIDWLEQQFPGWSIEVAATTTWADEMRPVWIAHKDGHHPQSELSAAKLHTRLSEYLQRESQRHALMN